MNYSFLLFYSPKPRSQVNFKKKKWKWSIFCVFIIPSLTSATAECWDEIKRHRKNTFYEYWIKWPKLNIITLTSVKIDS